MIKPLVSERAILWQMVGALDAEGDGACANAVSGSETLSDALAAIVRIRQITVAEAWQWAMATVAYGTGGE